MSSKQQTAFWDKVAACNHANLTDYYESFPCANEYCDGHETHCRDCGVFICECRCGFENGMSGHPRSRWSPRMRTGRAA